MNQSKEMSDLMDLAIELIKGSLMDDEFISWKAQVCYVDKDGRFIMKGNLSTIEHDGLGKKNNITYFGCTFSLHCVDDMANWGFGFKCESELYSTVDTKESGTNWSGCTPPDLHRPYDTRKENFERVSEAIYNAL